VVEVRGVQGDSSFERYDMPFERRTGPKWHDRHGPQPAHVDNSDNIAGCSRVNGNVRRLATMVRLPNSVLTADCLVRRNALTAEHGDELGD
jgi:hypothetical protein